MGNVEPAFGIFGFVSSYDAVIEFVNDFDDSNLSVMHENGR